MQHVTIKRINGQRENYLLNLFCIILNLHFKIAIYRFTVLNSYFECLFHKSRQLSVTNVELKSNGRIQIRRRLDSIRIQIFGFRTTAKNAGHISAHIWSVFSEKSRFNRCFHHWGFCRHMSFEKSITASFKSRSRSRMTF